MRKYLDIIKQAQKYLTEKQLEDHDFSKGDKVETSMGKGKIIEIGSEKEINKQRSLTSHLANHDARINQQALVKFEDGRTIWFSLFQLTPI